MALPSAKVAIIMRTKNRPLLLERAIKDVLKQDYTDWTLMVVNDGGSTGTVNDLIGTYSGEGLGRIHVLHNDAAVGMEAASNQGIRATQSVFIAIHDDDDEWREDFLRTTVQHLEGFQDQGVMVRTEIVYEQIVGDRIQVVGRELFEADVAEITLFDLLRHNRGVPISFLYRRSVHDQIGYYNESLPVVGDWEFHLRFLADYTIGFIDGEPRAYWNQRRESTGDMGNSVIARDDDHKKYDLHVREQYLKDYVEKHGVGALLYLTKLQDRQAQEFHHRADNVERRLQEILDVATSRHEVSEWTDKVEGKLQEILDEVNVRNSRLEQLEAAISDASLVSLIRRRYRRLKGRIFDRDE